MEAGIGINPADFEFIHRAVTEYMMASPEAKLVMLKLLNATVVQANYTKQYFPEGFFGVEEKRIGYKDLIEFRGWVYQNHTSVPWQMVETMDRPDLDRCDSCGGMFPKTYCAKVVRAILNGKEHLQTLCNRCRCHSDDLRIRQDSAAKDCQQCQLTSCQYHPQRRINEVKQLEHKPATEAAPSGPWWQDQKFAEFR